MINNLNKSSFFFLSDGIARPNILLICKKTKNLAYYKFFAEYDMKHNSGYRYQKLTI